MLCELLDMKPWTMNSIPNICACPCDYSYEIYFFIAKW